VSPLSPASLALFVGGMAAIPNGTINNLCCQFEFEAFTMRFGDWPAAIEAEEQRELGKLKVEQQCTVELGGSLRESLKGAKGHQRLVLMDMERGGLRLWLEQGWCEGNKAAKGDVGKVVDWCPKGEEDLGNVRGKLEEKIRAMTWNTPPIRPLAPWAVSRSLSKEGSRSMTEREAELTAVVRLRGGSSVTRALSGRGLGNIWMKDSYEEFTFFIDGRRYRCPSLVAEFLSPRVCHLHCSDPTIDEIMLEVEDRGELFGLVLEAARGGGITINSGNRLMCGMICAALWNSELCASVLRENGEAITMVNVLDRLEFLSASRCDISAELEFISSHFSDFSRQSNPLTALPFSLLYEIIDHRSLRLESEDYLYDFIRTCVETNPELLGLLEFIKFEYCSTDTMRKIFELISEDFEALNSSMWAGLCTRLTLRVSVDSPASQRATPDQHAMQFPPLVAQGWGFKVPDGIIAHLTRGYVRNVHDRKIVEVTSGSFERETISEYGSLANIVDMQLGSSFSSAHRNKEENIPHSKNNWVCYDFK
jgi:hypothetical protein